MSWGVGAEDAGRKKSEDDAKIIRAVKDIDGILPIGVVFCLWISLPVLVDGNPWADISDLARGIIHLMRSKRFTEKKTN